MLPYLAWQFLFSGLPYCTTPAVPIVVCAKGASWSTKANALAGKDGKLGKQCVWVRVSAPLSSPEWEIWLNVVDDCSDGLQEERGPPKYQKVSAIPLGKWRYVYFQPHCFLKNALAKSLLCLTSLACHICSFSHPVFNFVTICKHSYSPSRTNLITFEIGQKLLLLTQ